MRKIREALRLKAAGLAQREIAASWLVGRSTVGDYLDRAARAVDAKGESQETATREP